MTTTWTAADVRDAAEFCRGLRCGGDALRIELDWDGRYFVSKQDRGGAWRSVLGGRSAEALAGWLTEQEVQR